MASKKVSTTIRYVVPGTQPPIFLAGSFSTPEWQPAEMQYTTDEKNEHEFYREVEVEEGKEYQYKFRIGLGEWWMLNEGNPTATDNAGNRNNIISVPHSEQQETKDELEPKTETEERQPEDIQKPSESSSSPYLPLVHESSPVLNPAAPSSESQEKDETSSASQDKYLRQFDGSVDGGQHAREALPAEIETLTPITAPLSEDTQPKEPSPEPAVSTDKGSKTEDDSPEETTKPSTIESVKESALEIKDEWFGQKDSSEATHSDKQSSDNIVGDSAGQTQDDEKRNNEHSNGSETSDPVNQSDHTDDSFVLVPQHEHGDKASANGSATKTKDQSPLIEENQFEPTKPTEQQTSKVQEDVETANTAETEPSQADIPTTGSIPTEDQSTEHQSIRKSQDVTSDDQIPQEVDNSDTNKVVVGLQQSFDGAAPPAAPLPVTPYVVGNRELGEDGGPTREILSNDEGPIITVQPATPGPASLSTIEPSKQLGDTTSSAVDDGSSAQVTKRSKQGTPVSGRAASPASMRAMARDAKPNRGLLKTFLNLVFVEWIGKLFGKLWSGFKRQPPNEKLKIVVGCSVAVVAYVVLYR